MNEDKWDWSFIDRKRPRRRFLVVPETEEEFLALEDAYCDREDGKRQSLDPNHRSSPFDVLAPNARHRVRRPLPSTQALLSKMKKRTGGSGVSPSFQPSPLMQEFYKSIGMNDHESSTRAKDDQVDKDKQRDQTSPHPDIQTQQAIDEIDDPSFSTMKTGHHKRYLQLTKNSQDQSSNNRGFLVQKEFQKLRKMVREEQASYRLALDKFHDRYKSRYMTGFESGSRDKEQNIAAGAISYASGFCRWACSDAQSVNQEWKKAMEDTDKVSSDDQNHEGPNDIRPVSQYYGKVRQTLALHSRGDQSSLDIQDLTCSVVHESSPKPHSPTSNMSRGIATFSPKDVSPNGGDPQARQTIPVPRTESAPAVQLLRDDPKAIELAVQHSASIITTSETLETLLQLPGDHSSKWMVSCTTKTLQVPKSKSTSLSSFSMSVTILDIPIGQAFSSPRSCLERGLQEGLYQLFQQQEQRESQLETRGDSDAQSPVAQFVYSLWTLPTKKTGSGITSRKPIRLIIRTLIRLKDSVSKLPVRMRARAEYFATPVNPNDGERRGMGRSHREIPNSYEKSLWILDQVLFGHQAFCLQYRIDPTTCKILGWDVTSIAHAFAESSADKNQKAPTSRQATMAKNTSPLDHWKVLIQLLQSITAINTPEALLCLPGIVGSKGEKIVAESSVYDISEPKSTGTHTVQSGCTDTQEPKQKLQAQLDPFSVSVHSPCEDVSDPKPVIQSEGSDPQSSQPTICLDDEVLGRAGSVILGDQALHSCRRDWEWDRPGRVPNTFPVADDKGHAQ